MDSYTITCYATDGRQCEPNVMGTFEGTLDDAKACVDAMIPTAMPFAAWEERFGAWNREGAVYGWQVEATR